MNYSINELIVLPIMLIVIIAISIVCKKCLKNNLSKRIAMAIIPSIMLILEVIKQTREIIGGNYSTYTLPLHFCSLFMLFFAIAEYSTGEIRRVGQALSYATCILFLSLFYLNPTSVIGDSCGSVFESFGSFHTFTYHHLIILYFCMSVAMKMYMPKKKDIWYVVIGLSIYMIVGVTMANLLSTNYCNFLYSNIAFMEYIRVHTNYVLYLSLMYLYGIGASVLAFVLILAFNKIKTNKKAIKS